MVMCKKNLERALILMAMLYTISSSIVASDHGSIPLGYNVSLPEYPPPIERYYNKQIYNWAKNVSFRPEIVFVPKDKRELIEIVKQAKQYGKRITVIGKGHSWNPLMEGSDYLVSTIKLKQ